ATDDVVGIVRYRVDANGLGRRLLTERLCDEEEAEEPEVQRLINDGEGPLRIVETPDAPEKEDEARYLRQSVQMLEERAVLGPPLRIEHVRAVLHPAELVAGSNRHDIPAVVRKPPGHRRPESRIVDEEEATPPGRRFRHRPKKVGLLPARDV